MIVTSNQAPYAGSLEVMPSIGGTAFATDFTLSAPGWTDDVEDLPLLYTFAYEVPVNGSSLAPVWLGIPSYRLLSFTDKLFLPPGWRNATGHELMLRCEVKDPEGSSGQAFVSVRIAPPWSCKICSTSISSLVYSAETLDESSAMQSQQLVAAMVPLLRSNSTYLSLQNRVNVLSHMVQTTNRSFAFTKPENMDVVTELWGMLLQDWNLAKFTVKQRQALQALSTSNKQSNSSLVDQTVSSLIDLLMQQGTTTIQLTSDLIKVTVTKISGNTTIAIPDSKSFVSIGSTGGNDGAIVSVVQLDASLWTLTGNASSASSASTAPILASNVISIKMTFAANTSVAVIPPFTANLSVSPVSSEAPLFEHNCTVGVEEHVSFLCPESFIWFNLTCSGKAHAVMRRRCPVAQRV